MNTPDHDISAPCTGTPTSSTSRTVVDLPLMQRSFDRLSVEAARMQGQLSDLRHEIASMKEQLTSAAAETLARVDGKSVVTGAPAIILPKQLERNRKVPGTQLIYMGMLNHPRVGKPISLFTSQKDFGVMTANQAMERVGSAKNWEGHDGLQLGRDYGYEARVFEAWKDGRGMDQWVVMPMVVLSGKDYPGKDKIFEGNLFDNRNESDLKGTLNTSGSVVASWYCPCTENRAIPDVVWSVRFSDGYGDWGHRDYHRSSVRPCLAQELNHLTL